MTFLAITVGDVANVVAAMGAVAAVIASLVTVRRAGQTVSEARLARQESSEAHTEQVAELKAVREHTVAELRAVAAASAEAHREQMDERHRAFKDDLILRRGIQMQAIANIVMSLIDAARREHLDQPPPLAPGIHGRATRIPATVSRLRVAVRALEALGGPPLPMTEELFKLRPDFPLEYLGPGGTALWELDQRLGGDPLLQLSVPEGAPKSDQGS